ncbi:hypothetical protein SH139x_003514 [Planctomycetaceae bacterium SH139]
MKRRNTPPKSAKHSTIKRVRSLGVKTPALRRRDIHVAHTCAGTTLVEVVVSTLLVGIVLFTSLRASTVLHTSRRSNEDQVLIEAEALRLLEEISGLAYEEPDLAENDPREIGRDPGEGPNSRDRWDDIDDADGYSVSRLRTRERNPLPGSRVYSCAISVVWLSADRTQTVSEESGLKQVIITLTDQNNQQATATGLFSRFQPVPENWTAGYTITTSTSSGSTSSMMATPRNRTNGPEDIEL